MWVTRGSDVDHIWIALWVSGSSGSTGMTHFQPWYDTFGNLIRLPRNQGESQLEIRKSVGMSLFCFFFPPIFLSGNSFFPTYFAQNL